MSGKIRKKSVTPGNQRAAGYEGIVTGSSAAFLVKNGMRDAANYTKTKTQPATLWHIQPERPTPWYNRNPIAQGVHEVGGGWTGAKQAPTVRQGNNQA